jgi:hypothetical protein
MKPFVFRKVVQAIGLLVLAFILLRVLGPWLVDLHNTAALVLAAALLIGGAVLVAWFAWDLIISIQRRGDIDA